MHVQSKQIMKELVKIKKNIDEWTCDSVGNIFGNEETDGDENTLCALNDNVSEILASYDNVCISSTNDIVLSEKRASHGNDASHGLL